MTKQKTPRVLPAYLRARVAVLALLMLCTLIFAVVLTLHRVPQEAAWYAGALSLLPLLVAAWADYARFSQKHRALTQVRQGLPESLAHLPDAATLTEQGYQALLTAMGNTLRAQVSADAQRYQQMLSYYTLWSHQIKTPLAAMRLLLSKEDSQHARLLLSELHKTEHYVEMALHFMQLDDPGNDLRFAHHSPKELVGAATRRYAGQFVLKHLTLTVDVPEDATVLTDRKWLTFVVEQLLSNAVKYTQEGGVTIRWEDADQTLTVADTGLGILPEDLPRVFERGFTGYMGRVDHQATGIGLFLCREVCTRLGHTIALSSAPHGGTTARLTFPSRNLHQE